MLGNIVKNRINTILHEKMLIQLLILSKIAFKNNRFFLCTFVSNLSALKIVSILLGKRYDSFDTKVE
jgi:hypothetical protein